MALIVMAAVWKQISYNFLFFLAGLQSIPKSLIEAAAIDGAGPWRRFWTIVFPLLSPTTFFLLVINIVYAFFDTFAIVDATTQGGPGQGHRDPRLQGLLRRLQGARPRRLGGAVGGADGDRHRADGDPVPLRREEGPVLMAERHGRTPPASSTSVSHVVLRSACVIVAFPVYLTFVASTHTAAGDRAGADVARCPAATCSRTTGRRCSAARPAAAPTRAGGPHDVGEPGHRAGHHHRQDRDLAALGLRDRLLPLPVARRCASG